MAFVATLTGTGRNCTLTSGSATMTVSSNTGLVVGATIQGTGIPTGTKINSISGTTVVMSANATTGGTQSLIFSSVYGSTLTIVLNASGDVATWQNVFNAGFGLLQGTKSLFHPGALTITFGSIVAGARFDHQDWTVEYGSGGRQLFDSGLLAGEQRGGYDIAGSLLIKAAGPTFIFTSWNNGNPGGSSMFQNTGGLMTQGGTFRMHNARFIMRTGGSNAAFAFYSLRDNMIVENLILDYSEHTGANASIGFAYGTVLNPKIIQCNSGFSSGNGTAIGNLVGLQFLGIFTDSPAAKFAIQNNYVMEGYAPQVTSAQSIGGFQANSTETFANIDLSSPGWGLNDLKTKYLRFGGPNTINFPRRVTFEFNDSTGANLTNVTLYIRSGAISVINAVQAGDYSANTQALVGNWSASGGYRVATTLIDTINQVAQVRKYGYIQQSTSYSLNLAPYSQPFFMLTDDSLSGINEATAAAITTAGINWSTKTITPTTDLTYDQINARIAWELAQTANSAQADPRTILGSNLTLATGWSLVVNTGRTISAGTNITYLYAPTITLNGTGKITAVYATTAGTSTVLEINPPSDDYSLCIFKADGTTKYFASDVNSGSYYVYFTPAEAGTYYLAAEKYGQKRTADTLVLNGGNVWYNITDQEDVGITDNFATASAYTTLSTTSQIYDATAIFRLTETGIKLGQLVARDGLYLDFTTYNVKIKDDASAIVGVSSGTITYKSIVINESDKYNAMKATPPKTITPTDTEIINVLIEDANGDSQLSILGGDNLGYELWKVTTATPTDNYATGTLLTTLATNALPYRFIGISGFDIVGRDTSSGVRRRSSMLKGSYEQAFYVGNQIQLATDAPQLQENNDKLDELILKVETNLDAKVSTRLADADYIDPATAEDVWEYTTRTLTSAGASGATLAEIEGSLILAKEATSQDIKTKVLTLPTLAEMEDNSSNIAKENRLVTMQNTLEQFAGNDFDAVTDSLEAISNAIDTKPSLSDIENSTILAKETSVQDVKTKVDTLVNTDLTGIATTTDVTTAKDEVLEAINDIPTTDLTGITEDLTIINENVKDTSLFIPANRNL